MKNTILCFSCLAALTLSFGCAKKTTSDQDASAITQNASGDAISGIDRSAMNPEVRPQDDFYEYVNGTWLQTTELPSDKSDYGSFTELADEAELQLQAIVKEVSAKESVEQGSNEQKIRDYYNSYIAATDAEALMLGDLKTQELAKIDAIASLEDFYRVAGELDQVGIASPLGLYVSLDLKNPEVTTVYVSQSGLTLPDRDYYLEDEERYVKARDLYRGYVDTMLGFAGYEPAGEALLGLETAMAEISWTREQRRNPELRYNPYERAKLAELAPKINWETYLTATGAPLREQYIVAQPSYIENLDDLLASTDVATLKDYLRFKTLSRYSSVLGKPAVQASFDFYSKGLRGIKEQRPSWKRAISNINSSMGEILGQLYVSRHFKPEAKVRMKAMVAQLVSAYEVSIKELDWMSEPTRQKALEKLGTFYPKIGYPDKWRDYSSLTITDNALENARALATFEHFRRIDKLDKPVDRTEWFMPPQRVNAYYYGAQNEIVFPAAILQPPFFNLEADEAVNYGGIGAVIGHEIGHGFDDQGRKFDSTGAMNDWWQPEDEQAFQAKKEALKAQYETFQVINGKTINGEFTSGENIGDLAGLSIAYRAYRMSLDGKEAPVIDGLTGDQRFFMGWAQVWRRLYTDEELERRLTVDPHSPSKARTNVIVRNIPAFYEAFDVKPGDAMYLEPEKRVKIW